MSIKRLFSGLLSVAIAVLLLLTPSLTASANAEDMAAQEVCHPLSDSSACNVCLSDSHPTGKILLSDELSEIGFFVFPGDTSDCQAISETDTPQFTFDLAGTYSGELSAPKPAGASGADEILIGRFYLTNHEFPESSVMTLTYNPDLGGAYQVILYGDRK